jgi:hypothetical protein
MLDDLDLLESAGPDLDAARARIEIARDAVLELLDAHDAPELRRLAARLDRIAADVRRVEEAVSGGVRGIARDDARPRSGVIGASGSPESGRVNREAGPRLHRRPG